MKRAIYILLLAAMAAPVGAVHGPMASHDRDAWIDHALTRLVETGWLPAPEKPFAELTNREAAELVARASERLLADAAAGGTATDATGASEIQSLVQEFKTELKRMEVNVLAVEDEFSRLHVVNDTLEGMIEPLRGKTGTQASGYSRGYLSTLRGMGPDSPLTPLSRQGANFVNLHLSSVPAPFVLFETDLRLWGSLGFIYDERINPDLEFRTLTLTTQVKGFTFRGGDFFRSYSPLVLWNTSPVHNLLEPTSFRRKRTDLEEILLMDRGPDWRMRGLEFLGSREWEKEGYLNRVSAAGMAGPIEPAGENSYASFFAGGRAGIEFLQNRGAVHGNALMLWDDETTAPILYDTGTAASIARRLRVVSLEPSGSVTVTSDVTVAARGEVAVSRYLDDTRAEPDPMVRTEGRAVLASGSVASHGVSLLGRYRNVQTSFLSPGAQTLRWSADPTMDGYETVDEGKDAGIVGLRNRFLLQDVGRPVFTAYDRITEMILPYGDATANRIGPTAGIAAALLEGGWVRPQVYYSSVREIEPDWIGTDPASRMAVDSAVNTATARRFKGIEGALELDLAKPLPGKGLEYFGVGYKSQESEVPGGGLKVDTLTVGIDGIPPADFLKGMLISLGFKRITAKGSEFALSSSRPGQSLAAYHLHLDTDALGTYEYRTLDLTRTVIAAGLKYTINPVFSVRGDWFGTTDKLGDLPDYDDRTNEWRLTYEASF